MATVPRRPQGATDPLAPRVDLADPAARAAWLEGMHEHVADLAAAALDATEAPARRDLGRREARRIIVESEEAIASAFAAVGHPPPAAAPPRHRARRAGGVR
jgi:hypothetical protein